MESFISQFVEQHENVTIGENVEDPSVINKRYRNHTMDLIGDFTPDIVYVLDVLNLSRKITLKRTNILRQYGDEVEQISVFLALFIGTMMKHNTENGNDRILFDIVFRLPDYENDTCNNIAMLKQTLLTLESSQYNHNQNHKFVLSASFPVKHYGDDTKSIKGIIGDIDDMLALKKAFYYKDFVENTHVITCDKNVSNEWKVPGHVQNIYSINIIDDIIHVEVKSPYVDILELNFIVNRGYDTNNDDEVHMFLMFYEKHLSKSFFCLEKDTTSYHNIIKPPCQILDCDEGNFDRLTKMLGIEDSCRSVDFYKKQLFNRSKITDKTPRPVVFSTKWNDRVSAEIFEIHSRKTPRSIQLTRHKIGTEKNILKKEIISRCTENIITNHMLTENVGKRYNQILHEYLRQLSEK